MLPTISFKKKIENIVAKIGAAKVIEIASAKGKYFKPKKIDISAKHPVIVLKMCNFIFFVLKFQKNFFLSIIKIIGSKPKNPLKKTNSPIG